MWRSVAGPCRLPSALVALVLALAASGCLGAGTQDAPPSDTGTRSTSATATAPPTSGPPAESPANADDIVLGGSVDRWPGGFLANLTAHNTGQHTYGFSQDYCMGGPWSARLSGPPGANLTYRDPSYHSLGCAGDRLGRLGPGEWYNWTADPDCRFAHVCDNQWDGRLWDEDRTAHQAPPGRYSWEFRFPYYDEPARSENGTFTEPAGRQLKTLAFAVDWG